MSPPLVTIISGASSGIGAALAGRLARQPGAHLALIGRDATRLEAVAQAGRASGATITTVIRDVRDRAGLAAWMAGFDAAHPVGCVISNAGIAASSLSDAGPETADEVYEVLDVNLTGALNVALPLIPAMRARRQGRIVLVSSLAAFAPLPGNEAYSASKAALLTYGLALRQSLAPDGVAVNVVCPGFVTTPMSRAFRGWKPMEISAEDAAARIERGLARNARIIAFPWPLVLASRATPFVPEGPLRLAMRLFKL